MGAGASVSDALFEKEFLEDAKKRGFTDEQLDFVREKFSKMSRDNKTTDNIILLTDSYKVSHHIQYPPKTTKVYSYFESRGGKFKEVRSREMEEELKGIEEMISTLLSIVSLSYVSPIQSR